MAISKRLRYEILRRDRFACRYCGATADEVRITVDHVNPVALGGTDHPSNLVAACKDCNAGKAAATPDTTLVDDVHTDSQLWEEAKAQAAEGRKANIYRGFDDEIAEVDDAWSTWGYETPEGGRIGVPKDPQWKLNIRVWLLRGLPVDELIEFIPTVMRKQDVEMRNKWRYLAGCAWRTIENIEAETEAAYDALKRAQHEPAPPRRSSTRRAMTWDDLEFPDMPTRPDGQY